MNSPALKEWGAAVQALLDGRQTVLLRKGGIKATQFIDQQQRLRIDGATLRLLQSLLAGGQHGIPRICR